MSELAWADHWFDFPDIGALAPSEAEIAISKPLAGLHVPSGPDALQKIIIETRGYPYFLQEWGKHAWDVADFADHRIVPEMWPSVWGAR